MSWIYLFTVSYDNHKQTLDDTIVNFIKQISLLNKQKALIFCGLKSYVETEISING